jgi:phosphate transport system substrate-binding protein
MNKIVNSKIVRALALCGVVLFLGAADGIAKKKTDRLTIGGSTTVLPIAQLCSETFMDANPAVNISVRGGGSSVGIAGIIDGNVDIADSSRPIKNRELQLARQKGLNLKEIAIARDGLAIIVNNSNPVKNLTPAQLKDVFTGKIDNWKTLGGPGMSIVVVSRDTSSGTFESFSSLVLKGAKVKDGALMLPSNKAVAGTVSETPGAIGYIGVGFISDQEKVVSVDGITASQETVRNGTYKLSRSLYMYVNGEPGGMLKKFIDFVLSSEGQKLVEEAGYVSK